MMLYKREEPFRFHFQTPIPATFKICQLDQLGKGSNLGLAQVLDVSPNGLRMKTLFDLPLKEKNFLLEFNFKINEKQIRILGNIVWKKREGSSFTYGIIGREDDETKHELIEELKELSRNSQRKLRQ